MELSKVDGASAPSSGRHINDLPDLPLRIIFSKLPLSDLLRIDHVCNRWKSLQAAVCSTVKEIVISVGDEAIGLLKEPRFPILHRDELTNPSAIKGASPHHGRLNNFAHLDFDWLDQSTARFLIKLLPNITDAQIAFRGIPPTSSIGEKSWGVKSIALHQLIDLLTAWRHRLVSFKLCTSFSDYIQQEHLERDMPRLLATLNSLEALRHLTLELQNSFFYDRERTPLDLPFLSRLETFFLDFMDSTELVYNSFTKYAAPNESLRAIGFSNIYDTDLSNPFFQRISPESADFYRKFTHFPSLEFSEPVESMRLFCERFSSLTKISLGVLNIPMIYKMVRYLKPLKDLVYLEVNINFEEDHAQAALDAEMEMEMLRAPSVLPSVRILFLYAPLQRHTDLYQVQWHVMFPNLEILHYHDGWNDCQICMPRSDTDSSSSSSSDSDSDSESEVEEGAEQPIRQLVPRWLFEDQDGEAEFPFNIVPEVNLEENRQEETDDDDDDELNFEMPFDFDLVVVLPLEVDEGAEADSEDNDSEDGSSVYTDAEDDAHVDADDEAEAEESKDVNQGRNGGGEQGQEEDDDLNLDLLFALPAEVAVNAVIEEEAPHQTSDEEMEDKRQKCLRLSVQPWRHCEKLKKVYTGDSDDAKLWKLEDLWTPAKSHQEAPAEA